MMTRLQKIELLLLVLLVFAAGLFGAQWVGLLGSKPIEAAPAPVAEPDVVRYPPGAPQLSSVRVAAADEFPVPLAEPLNARVAYDENVTTRVSSPIAGRVVSLKLQPGDPVRAGAVLAVLDSPDLAAARADLDKAQADESRKRAAQERARLLLEGGVLARKEFENAESDFLQARAESVRAARRLANLVPGGQGDGQFALRSPLGGVVVERQVNPGMEVRPDLPNPLYVVTDPSRLWVLIDLPERNLSKVELGHSVSIEVDAWPGERFEGRIVKIGEVVDPATRRIQVRCSVDNPVRKLKPEMYAKVTLLADANQRAVRVPNSALVTEGIYSFLFVEREPGVYVRRKVSFSVQDRDFGYIAGGLARGEKVVVQGALLISAELKSGS